eukprot:1224461-Pyramimonas_sp.AAC.1
MHHVCSVGLSRAFTSLAAKQTQFWYPNNHCITSFSVQKLPVTLYRTAPTARQYSVAVLVATLRTTAPSSHLN